MTVGIGEIPVGKLLRANATGFVLGCRVNESDRVTFGGLVRVKTRDDALAIYGLIYDITVNDDDLIKQLSISTGITEEQRLDQLLNRQVPIELSVLAVGYRENGIIHRRIPPRPPLNLDRVSLCTNEDIQTFTDRLDHFRLVLRHKIREVPIEQLMVAHVAQVYQARGNDKEWVVRAASELIAQLREDHATLLPLLEALGEAIPDIATQGEDRVTMISNQPGL